MSTGNPSPNPKNPNDFEKSDPFKQDPNFRTKETKYTTPPPDAILDYIKGNTKDSIAYVILVVGVLLMLFNSYSALGSLLVGIIFSLYFINEIIFVTTNIKDLIEEYGLVKSIVLGSTLLVLFVKLPLLFIGIALVAVVKIFFWTDQKHDL